jgi:hypothetical protein
LVIGYFLVTYHNIWISGWTVIITILGWMSFIKGLMMIVIPERSVKLYKAIKITERQLAVYGAIVVVIGIVCFYLGYFA